MLHFEAFAFGSLRIDGVTYQHDVVIDHGQVRKRKKKPSKAFREDFGHTPLSVAEDIPWTCRRLVIGTGTRALPVMDEVKHEARRRRVKLIILPTAEAIARLKKHPEQANAILHVMCQVFWSKFERDAMARAGLSSRMDIKRGCGALLAQGQRPSIDAKRIAPGNTGWKTTIHRYTGPRELLSIGGSLVECFEGIHCSGVIGNATRTPAKLAYYSEMREDRNITPPTARDRNPLVAAQASARLPVCGELPRFISGCGTPAPESGCASVPSASRCRAVSPEPRAGHATPSRSGRNAASGPR